MSADPPRPSFLQELKRRKVVRVALVYTVAAVATVEAADLFFPNLNLPEWSVPLVVALAVVGLPFALVLAWAYEVTPTGIERQKGLPHLGGEPGASSDSHPHQAEPPEPQEGAAPVITEAVDRRSVAVLPFSNLSPDSQHIYFADGMTEDVLAHLGKVKALRVTSRTSVLRYRDTTKPVREIAAELGVAAVLEGSIRATAERVRVVAQLIDARTDTHLWAESYDRDLEDIFAVQSEVAESVARALTVELSGEELTEIHQPPTDDPAAYALFLEGMAAYQTHQPGQYARALGLFEGAVRMDPGYARAHAGLALLLTAYPWTTARLPDHYLERLEHAVRRARELDPDSAHSWVARGFYLSTCEHDWLGAEDAFERASRLAPDDLQVLWIRAFHAYRLGRFDEAEECLDALDAFGHSSISAETYRAGVEVHRAAFGDLDFEVPLRRLDALVEKQPTSGLAHLYRGVALSWSGRSNEAALEAAESGLRYAPEVALLHAHRGAILTRQGRLQEALAEEEWFARTESADPAARSLLHFAMGRVDSGFELLAEAVKNPTAFTLPFIRLNPAIRPLWEHARFVALMDAIWPGEQKRVLGEYGWQPGSPAGQPLPSPGTPPSLSSR